MVEKDIIPKVLIPNRHNYLGWAARLFSVSLLATTLAIINSRDSDSSSLEYIFNNPNIKAEMSPNRKYIVYSERLFDDSGNGSINITILDMNENSVVVDFTNERYGNFGKTKFSKDGNSFAYTSTYMERTNGGAQMDPHIESDIFSVDLKTGVRNTVASNQDNSFDDPVWNQDGTISAKDELGVTTTFSQNGSVLKKTP